MTTLVLLGFLVLVVVGLLATTRVETQVAAAHDRQAQARANALMALHIAIGQLQKHAGPDARITAQASLADAAVENPWFTGVWDVGGSGEASTLPTAWLVSGNEAGPADITPATSLHRTEAEVPLRFVNGLAANGPGAADCNTVRLVGPRTADTGGAGPANGAVAVPGVPINAVAPGLGVTRTVGRYAFWVGDQGVKASLALPDLSAGVNYAPWLTVDAAGVVTGDQRDRIRQQLGAARPFARAAVEDNAVTTNYTGGEAPGADAVREILTDATLDSTGAGGGPAFFRFPQSAQETYFWSNSAKVASESGVFSRQYFREGVRGGSDAIAGRAAHTLTTAQVAAMSREIVALVRQKVAAGGPFRGIEEFLAPQAIFGGASLLEKAIADCGVNAAGVAVAATVPNFTDPGFSSLTLTQADIMTALAPFLRTRSDTFVVRAYGEAINPATQAVAGRAWCEATVQRFPETVAPGDSIAAPDAGGFGRRFKIISFRWLSSDDI